MKKIIVSSGFALPIVLMMLVLLTVIGVVTAKMSNEEVKSSAMLNRYSKAFVLAQGAAEVPLFILENKTPMADQAHPDKPGVIPQTELVSAGIDLASMETSGSSDKAIPTVQYHGFTTRIPPGWGINDQTYYTFVRYYYEVQGVGIKKAYDKTSEVEAARTQVNIAVMKLVKS